MNVNPAKANQIEVGKNHYARVNPKLLK